MSTNKKYASITNDGAILMGNLFCCDGHSYERKYFAFSHMHSDHSEKLQKCLGNGQVFFSKPTRDLLEAVNDENYGSELNKIKKIQISTLDYNTPIMVSSNGVNEQITFYESEHVLGASQIEIVVSSGKKIVYSGDITPKDEPPKNIHTLIVDSTHGHPQYSKVADTSSVERRFKERLHDIILRGLSTGRGAQPVVIHAHQGKLQEIMSLVSQFHDLDEYSFQTSEINIRIADVYRKYNFKLRDKILDQTCIEAEEKRDSDWPYIQFVTSFEKKTYERSEKAHSIFFYDSLSTGQQIDESIPNTTRYATTAHADFLNVIDYVKKANPDNVIVDNFRTKQGIALTAKLQSEGFTVEFQPGN